MYEKGVGAVGGGRRMNVRRSDRASYLACGLFLRGSGALYGGLSGKRVAYDLEGIGLSLKGSRGFMTDGLMG